MGICVGSTVCIGGVLHRVPILSGSLDRQTGLIDFLLWVWGRQRVMQGHIVSVVVGADETSSGPLILNGRASYAAR